MGVIPWMNIDIIGPHSDKLEQVGGPVTGSWRGGDLPVEGTGLDRFPGISRDALAGCVAAMPLFGLHPELGQWVHAGTSCRLSRCPEKGGNHMMLWGEGFGGACCCWKGLLLTPFCWERGQLLSGFSVLLWRCARAVGCCVLVHGVQSLIPELVASSCCGMPRSSRARVTGDLLAGARGGWRREAEDGAQLLWCGAGR